MKTEERTSGIVIVLTAGVLLTAGMGLGAETHDIAPTAVWSPHANVPVRSTDA